MPAKQTPEQLLEQMVEILKEIITIATQLQKLTQQIVSKDQIRPLQDQQKVLLDKLLEIDSSFNEACGGTPNGVDSPTRKRIGKMLKEFQALNTSFAENLSKSKGVIPLEIHHIKKLSQE